jgi:hypothetical protein
MKRQIKQLENNPITGYPIYSRKDLSIERHRCFNSVIYYTADASIKISEDNLKRLENANRFKK